MLVRLHIWLRRKNIDGSRLTILKFIKDWNDYSKIKEERHVLGIYNKRSNLFSINPEIINDENIKELTTIISHEFLHMLLYIEHKSMVICNKMDNVCGNIDDLHTDNGGI